MDFILFMILAVIILVTSMVMSYALGRAHGWLDARDDYHEALEGDWNGS